MWGIWNTFLVRLVAGILVVAHLATPFAHAAQMRMSDDPLALVCAMPGMSESKPVGGELRALLDEKQQGDADDPGMFKCAFCVLLHAYAIPPAPSVDLVIPVAAGVFLPAYVRVVASRSAGPALGARGPPSFR
ncbi:MAG: hypothetical protein CVT79_00765 [Alphaproteobacteria bacterium HGW-Alphaproteobacteria-18]|nr:MAG: hypothetical protein CVT79_00765 [Alphaproteobacteria bacterium HGW-Alphaproteobacteria-18]